MVAEFKGRSTVISMAFFDFMRMAGIFMVLPVFTIYGYEFTTNAVLIGIAFGGYGLAMAFMQTPLGILSDRIGRKKVIIGGMIPYIAGNFIAYHPVNIYILILARLLTGTGAIGAASTAFVEESVSGNRMNIAMAFIGVSAGLAFMAGMIIGPVLTTATGVSSIFLVSAILGIIALVPVAVLKEERDPAEIRKHDSGGKIEKIGIKAGIISFIFSFYVMVFFFYIPLYYLRVSGLKNYSTLLVIPVIIGGIVAALVSMDADRGKRTSLYGFIALIISAISVPFIFLFPESVNSFSGIFIGLTLFFISYSIYEIVFPPLISKIAGRKNYGANMGINNSLRSLGQFIGAVSAGIFLNISLRSTDVNRISYILIAILAFSILFYYVEVYRTHRV
ncbi:MAG: MFS transporter [Thermoplasmata archaeon]